MTIRHLYPAVEPSLNLDFANSKKLDSRITFTRASTGTYTDESGIIRTAAANEARFDHDGDGNSLGLLIEESRTNNLPYSNEFMSGLWRYTTMTPNAGVSPSGTNDAWLLDSGLRDYNQLTSRGYLSIFVKKVTARYFILSGGPQASLPGYCFDLDTGTALRATGNSPAGSLPTITAYPNGWYRVGVYTDTSNRRFSFGCSNDPDFNLGTGGYDGQVLVYGGQGELGAFPTSYIPTTSSTVTRSADVASMTGTNFSSWYNQSAGTLFLDIPRNLTNVDINNLLFSITNGSADRLRAQWVDDTWYWKANAQIPIVPKVGASSTAGKYIFGYDDTTATSFATYNGQAVNTGSRTSTVTDASELRLFTQWDGQRPVYGHISRLTYYPVRLPDATLQALTL